eukprot:s379_g23.t1
MESFAKLMHVRCCSAVTGAEVTVQLPTTATISDLRRILFGHLNDLQIVQEDQIRILLHNEPVIGSEQVDGEHIYDYVVVSPDLHNAFEYVRLTEMMLSATSFGISSFCLNC